MSIFLVPHKKPQKKKEQAITRRRREMREHRSFLLQKQADVWAKQYPELYAKVRSPFWRAWYESVMCQPWNPDWESTPTEIRWMVDEAETLDVERSQDWQRRHAEIMLGERNLTGQEKRRYILTLATPKWADRREIQEVYLQRDRINAETGVEHHVDHEIPLQGALVTGLHVASNLRIIPAYENLSKSNRFKVL